MASRRALVVALLSGVALSFAYPEPDVAPLAWGAIAPLLVVTRGVSWRRGARLGFVFGVGFFGSLLVWVSIVGWVAWAILVTYQSVSIAAFGALWGPLSRDRGWITRVALAAGLWAAFEYLRAAVPVFGFPWGQLAQSQHELPWMLRVAGLGGGIFLGLVVAALNALGAEAFVALRQRRRTDALIAAVAVVVLVGAPLLLPSAEPGEQEIDVAIVQGDVDPTEPPSHEKELGIVSRHSALTHDLERPVDLVVWPESSVGIDPDSEPVVAEAITASARAAGAPMLVGANRDRGGNNYLVTILEVSPAGEIVDEYQKTHLVPFGEYIPARRLLDWIPMLDQIPRDAIAGNEPKVFDVAGGKVAGVLSFEGDFGSLVRGRIARGGRLLIVATNTSTWRRSWTSAQHVAFSQVRAAENGVYVLHAAISGISAIVAPNGDVVASTDLYEQATMIEKVAFADDVTVYARIGDWGLLVAILLCVGPAALARERDGVASGDG